MKLLLLPLGKPHRVYLEIRFLSISITFFGFALLFNRVNLVRCGLD